MKPLLTYRCGHRDGGACLLAVVAVVDGVTRFAPVRGTPLDVPPERSAGVVDTLLPLRCDHLNMDLHPAVVRRDLAAGHAGRVVIVRAQP